MAQLIITLIIAGAVLYVVKVLPIDPTFKTIVNVVVLVAVAIWLLREYVPALGVG